MKPKSNRNLFHNFLNLKCYVKRNNAPLAKELHQMQSYPNVLSSASISSNSRKQCYKDRRVEYLKNLTIF